MPAARIFLETFPPSVRRLLERVAALAGGSTWLVGGALREALLGNAVGELDVAVVTGAVRLGRALADDLDAAGFVVLDDARGVCRVLAEVQLDIADLRAPTLADDLR